MPRERTYTYEGLKDGLSWRNTVRHLDLLLDDIEDELDRATPGTTVTFTVTVGEAR